MTNAPFINRELSWLSFNRRVLAETTKLGVLPLERLKFLAITASNLDEFTMVRAAYLNDRQDMLSKDDSGLTYSEQLELVLTEIRAFHALQAERALEILTELRREGISLLKINELNQEQFDFIRKYFEKDVLPVLTPLAIDQSRPFPFLSNLSLNIGVRLEDSGKTLYAVVQIPSLLPRFVGLPSGSGREFLPLEDLIAYFLPDICNLHKIKAYGFFRITRSADFDADEHTDDLMEEMKRTIKKRKHGRAIRLELSSGFDAKMRSYLLDVLDIGKKFVIETDCYLGLNSFFKIAALEGYCHLRTEQFSPPPSSLDCEDIFKTIREGDRFLHHPYDSFDPVIDFIKSAAADPDVLAIKQTLYRVSGDSSVIAALEQASEAGKQVTVLVELKARFDEEKNIRWANRLERAGCHVIYGLTGLKTHCKVTLIVRREEGGIRRYLHFSTGNYNDETAKVYTDIGLFTCDPAFGEDASALFNNLTGFSAPPKYNKLVVAPEHLRPFILAKIDREIENSKAGRPCGIKIKANSLLENLVIKKLYEASEAGVPINLIIRGICGLLPGVPGFSENIKVRSIIGRFLEHSRIFIFENGGDPIYYLGSADLMPRNLIRRVEIIFPIEAAEIKLQLRDLFSLMLSDNVCAWELNSNGEYNRAEQTGEPINSQAILAEGK